jgi:hypothetical protein
MFGGCLICNVVVEVGAKALFPDKCDDAPFRAAFTPTFHLLTTPATQPISEAPLTWRVIDASLNVR